MPPPAPAQEPGSPNVDRAPVGPGAQAAASALLALSRAARSFTLYDPSNAVVRQLIAEYQARMRAAVDAHGALVIEVRPFELAVGGEPVYKDLDREKSLAFRLYRDGVRRLTLRPTVVWGELLRLLEILAVRFTGIRQGEDDTVTLLRRADLKGIELEAVEGYVPAEESPEPGAGDDEVERAQAFSLSPAWDLPLPALPQPGPISWREVPEELLVPLRPAADDDDEVAALALSVARDLLTEAGRAGWPAGSPELTGFLSEVRDALLAAGSLTALRKLVDLLGEVGGSDLRGELLRSLGDARTLTLVLESVPEDAARLPPDLVPFLPLLGMPAALDALAGQATEGRRRLLLQIVLARLPREADAVMARLPSLEVRLARDLARGLVARAPERAAEVARQLLALGDEELRREGLAALEGSPGDIPMRPISALLHDASEAVRVRAAEVLERRGDASVMDELQAALTTREPGHREAEALGRALAAVAPIPAARLFAGWLEPKGRFLRGLTDQQRAWQWAAVAGTGALPGDPEPQLAALAQRSEGELRQHCLATIARRRKEQHGGPARGG